MAEIERNKRIRFLEEDRQARVDSLREKTGIRLPTYSASQIDSRSVSGNIENFIGTIQVPTGLIGPLRFRFKNHEEEVLAPFSTTEGALISSIQRGSLALNLSGGVTTRLVSSQMTRAPQFEFSSIDAALEFSQWIQLRLPELQALVKRKSQYAELIRLEPKAFGRSVHCRFVYTTGNAAGQNMTTFCTSYLCRYLLDRWAEGFADPHFRCVDFLIEGNISSDKKVSALSILAGRGRTVVAESIIRGSVLKKVLKLHPEEFVQRFHRTKAAHILTGFLGYNINVANVVAGLFLSTGQDMACVHESSIGEFHVELRQGDVYCSLYMPCLVVGTVGGGTHLPSFRDNLAILKCLEVEGGADRLAQIIVGYALALEMSTVCAIGSGDFVSAHEKYGRLSREDSLKLSDFDRDFFSRSLSDEGVLRVEKIPADNKQGFVTDIALQVSKKMTGLLAFEIEIQNAVKKRTFLKIKPHDREITQGCAKIMESLSPGLAGIILKKKDFLPFKESHLREIEVLSRKHPLIAGLSPEYYGSFIDDKKEAYVLIEELLDSSLIVSEINDTSYLTPDLKLRVVDKISEIHRHFLNRKQLALELSPRLLSFASDERVEEQAELWDGLFSFSYAKLKTSYPHLFAAYDSTLQDYSNFVRQWASLDHSLIHYDFNPRNMAFDSDQRIYVFDWEFAAWAPPQRDLVEFVLFTSKNGQLIQDLEVLSKKAFDTIYGKGPQHQWNEGVRLCLLEFIVRRLPFYFVLSELSFCSYLDSLLANVETLCRHYEAAN